jgi:hypothetical protein
MAANDDTSVDATAASAWAFWLAHPAMTIARRPSGSHARGNGENSNN